jgi:hypothetical protein
MSATSNTIPRPAAVPDSYKVKRPSSSFTQQWCAAGLGAMVGVPVGFVLANKVPALGPLKGVVIGGSIALGVATGVMGARFLAGRGYDEFDDRPGRTHVPKHPRATDGIVP